MEKSPVVCVSLKIMLSIDFKKDVKMAQSYSLIKVSYH